MVVLFWICGVGFLELEFCDGSGKKVVVVDV